MTSGCLIMNFYMETVNENDVYSNIENIEPSTPTGRLLVNNANDEMLENYETN